MTKPHATFAENAADEADQWFPHNRECPFGGGVKIEGMFHPGYYYRVKVHKFGEPPTSFTPLTDSFSLQRWFTPPSYDLQISSGGFFAYKDPMLYVDRTLARWTSSGDDMWEVQLDIATAPNESSIISSTPWYKIQLDNTGRKGPTDPPSAVPPTMDIHIDPLLGQPGDCRDVTEGQSFDGTFIAKDTHFGYWTLSTLPNTATTPSNQPTVTGLDHTDPTPGPSGYKWSLDTGSPIAMHPCGYVVSLTVYDRSIVGSKHGQHNWNHIEVGFCLRKKTV
jgi:hypothetical protein